MKKRKFNLLFLVFLGLLSFCSKQETPELYSNYISIQVTEFASNIDSEKVVQLYIKNDSDKEFEQECIVSYSLQNSTTGEYFHSEEILFNKMVPNLPNGLFNLMYRGTYTYNKKLNDLRWNNLDYSKIEPGDYIFRAQLFIRAPISPANLIHSNTLQLSKD